MRKGSDNCTQDRSERKGDFGAGGQKSKKRLKIFWKRFQKSVDKRKFAYYDEEKREN